MDSAYVPMQDTIFKKRKGHDKSMPFAVHAVSHGTSQKISLKELSVHWSTKIASLYAHSLIESS